MATNWNMKEATKAILSGDKEAMVDIGRRFPLAAIAIAQMGNNAGALTIINALPDHISVRKIESVLKDGVQELSDDTEEVMPKPEEPKTSGRGKKKVEKEEPVKAKEKKTVAKKNDEGDSEDLESMSEVELFKLCKKKGIKAAPKQDKEYYIDLLTPADSDDEEDEEWDDEEEEKPAKKDKKTAKKSKKDEDDDEDDDWNI